jgi:hypothetical protein
MRIFWFNTDKEQDPLTLLHDTEPPRPSHPLHFPPEILQKIIDFLPRSSLASVAGINRAWYAIAMPVLYRHLYIRTLPHWLLLVRSFHDPTFSARWGPCIHSLVLKSSPRLISSQLTGYLNRRVIENDDELQPSLRGYVRLERVNYNLTGLENIDKPMLFEGEQGQEENENYTETNTTQKESEWLLRVFDEHIATVLQDALQLEYLNVSGCEELNDNVLVTIAAAKCKQHYSLQAKPMVGLWMSLLRSTTPIGISELIRVEKMLRLERKLKYLDLGFQNMMTDEVIKQIAEYWNTSLVSVRLNSIFGLSDLTVEHLARHCPNLRLLHLVRCWNITNAPLQLLAKNCKELTYVSVSFLRETSEAGIGHLIRQCPKLIWLDITRCGINSMFKQMILEGWKQDRIQKNLPPVYIQDGSINLVTTSSE